MQVDYGGRLCRGCSLLQQRPSSPVRSSPLKRPASSLEEEETGRTVAKRPSSDEAPPHPALPTDGGSDLVHHIWLSLDEEISLPTCARGCVEAYAKAMSGKGVQILWVWEHSSSRARRQIASWNAKNARVECVDSFLPFDENLLRHNVPIQWLKDVASMLLLHTYGGWFTDLDVWPLVPLSAWRRLRGYAFAADHWRQDARGTKERTLSLAIFAMPAGAPIAMELADAFERNAREHAVAIATNTRVRRNWSKGQEAHWMSNTKMFSNTVATTPSLPEAIAPPDIFIPFPQWLPSWPEAGTEAAPAKPVLQDAEAAPASCARDAEAAPASCARDAEAAPASCARDAEAAPASCARDAEAAPASSAPASCAHVAEAAPATSDAISLRGCVVPSLRYAATHASAINLWWRQWPMAQRTAAMYWASQCLQDNSAGSLVAQAQQTLRDLAVGVQQYVTEAFAMRVFSGALTKIAAPDLVRRIETGAVRQAGYTPQEIARAVFYTELGLESCVAGYPDPQSVSETLHGLLAQSESARTQDMAFIQTTLPGIDRAREFCLSGHGSLNRDRMRRLVALFVHWSWGPDDERCKKNAIPPTTLDQHPSRHHPLFLARSLGAFGHYGDGGGNVLQTEPCFVICYATPPRNTHTNFSMFLFLLLPSPKKREKRKNTHLMRWPTMCRKGFGQFVFLRSEAGATLEAFRGAAGSR